MKTNGYPGFSDEFIKISGPNGSERFLKNSYTTRWYGDEGEPYRALRSSRTLFWSAKRLEGNTVVKDFTGPIKSVIIQKDFDESGNLTGMTVLFSNDGNSANESFHIWDSLSNYYTCDMDTLKDYGDPKSGLI